MEKNNERKRVAIIFAIVLFLLTTIGIGYSTLTTNIKVEGTVKIDDVKWAIGYEMPKVTEGSITAIKDITTDWTEGTTSLNYSLEFTTPGQFYEFTVKVKNSGTINAKLSNVTITPISKEDSEYLTYSVVDTSTGLAPVVGTELSANSSMTFKVRVDFAKDIDNDNKELTIDAKTLNLNFSTTFVQAD